MIKNQHSKSNEFLTPVDLFTACEKHFGPYTLDVAAAPDNAKCAEYFTRETNGLMHKWHGTVWCNPPYTGVRRAGKTEIYKWVRKSIREFYRDHCCSITLLLPCKTEQRWFHELVIPTPFDIYFISGRVSFDNKIHSGPATFPYLVLHLGKRWAGICNVAGTIDRNGEEYKVNGITCAGWIV
jgi:site-specific DNA-methyltransferase (adenine-specific)